MCGVFVGISFLQCFTSRTWIIIGGPPLDTFQSVWRYSPKKRHGQYRIFVGSITVLHYSATDSEAECFLYRSSGPFDQYPAQAGVQLLNVFGCPQLSPRSFNYTALQNHIKCGSQFCNQLIFVGYEIQVLRSLGHIFLLFIFLLW